MNTQVSASIREHSKALIMEFMRLWGAGQWWDDPESDRPARLYAMMTPDIDWWAIGLPPGETMTVEGVASLLRSVAAGDLTFRFLDWTVEHPRYAVTGTSHMPLKNGDVYENVYHWLFEMRDGQISRFHEYLDSAVVARKYAFATSTPASAEKPVRS